MNLQTLGNLVWRHFRESATAYGLHPSDLTVESVLNPGGFLNAHFAVSDGRRSYHLKLASNPESEVQLRHWSGLSHLLAARYRAPQVVAHVRIPETPYEGLLLERIEGSHPDLPSALSLVAEIHALLEGLHADGEIERELAARGSRGDARGSVLARSVECLEADLEESGDRFPVPPETLSWMQEETAALRTAVETESSFDQVHPVPIHGDVWEANILVEPDGRWLLLDWDGLTLGDPVLDDALLLWPLACAGADPGQWLGAKAADPTYMRRFQLCLRGYLLEEVIDALADWVESEASPADVESVRTTKIEAHRRALVKYRARYC